MTEGTTTRTPPAPVATQRARRRGWMLGAGIGLTAAYLLASGGAFAERPVFTSPQGNVTYVLSQRFAEGGGFRHPLPAAHLDDDIRRAMVPRDAAGDGDAVIAKDFAGPMLLFGMLLWLWAPLAWLASPLAAAGSALLAGALVGLLRPEWRRASAVASASALVAAYPPLVLSAQPFTSDAIALVFALAAMLFFVRFWRDLETRDLVLMAAALGLTTLFRYPNIVLALPVIVALLATRRLTVRRMLIAAVAIAPSVLALALFNHANYGSPFRTGYGVGLQLLQETVDFSSDGVLRFHPGDAARYLRFYLVTSPLMLAPAIFGLVIGWALWQRRSVDRWLTGTVLSAACLVLLLHIGQPGWGRVLPVVNASVLRYMLPAAALGMVFLAGFLGRTSGWKRAASITVVVVLVAGSAATVVFSREGLLHRSKFVAWHLQVRDQVLEHTEPEALIAAKVADKYLWPHRQTLTLTYLVDGDAVALPGAARPWDHLPTPERFADVAARVRAAGIPLYLLDDLLAPAGVLHGYRSALAARDLTMTRVPGVAEPLYRIG